MGALIFTLLMALTMTSCESPMNQRVNGKSLLSQQKVSFTGLSIIAEVKWLEGPHGNINRNNHVMVFLYRGESLYSLPSGQTLEFYASMPSMGHPLHDVGFFEEIDTGIYVNKGIRYNMPGDWKNELWIMDESFNILDRLQWLIYF